MITPVKRVTLSEAVLKQLSDLITMGQFEPEARLPPERELAQQ
jgi:DNA-binding FadR family transcriptional regulator